MSLESDRLNPLAARIRELEARAERAEAERDAAAEILYGEPLQSRLAAADRLAEAAKEASRFIGDVDCSGYKCRLPQCSDCYEDAESCYPAEEALRKALAAYEAARKGEEGGR